MGSSSIYPLQVKLGKFAIKQHQGELKDQLSRMCSVQDSVTEVKINIQDLVLFDNFIRV